MRVGAFLLAVLVLALFPVAASADYAHLVAPGETLTSVAATDGLSIEAIARANGISPNAELIAGQTLWIPPRMADDAVAVTAAGATTATDAGVTATTDTDATTGTGDATTTATRVSTTSSHPTPEAGGPVPTLERVSAAEIAAVANAYGVPANLAEAVAWQESGWNNAEVSNIGAVGVMQIVPSTWSWINRYLTPSNPLGPASASENIRAGVLLLHQLLQLTGGNEQLAAAGYYQGLMSVKRLGMYASTRLYVADVLALAERL